MYGHVEKLAEEIKKGAASIEGVEAKLWQAAMNIVEEKLKDCSTSERDIHSSQVNDLKFNELECQDVRINNDDGSDLTFKRNQPDLTTTITVGNNDASKALAVALNEKVETLLLLSQQEERHLLERNR